MNNSSNQNYNRKDNLPSGSTGGYFLNPLRRNNLGRLGLFSPFLLFDEEVNALFNGAGEAAKLSGNSEKFFAPKLHLEETAAEYLISCDLPGLTEKDVDLTLTDEGLKISGERKHSEERKEGSKVIHSETIYGRFERFITFNTPIDSTKIDASMKNGQLKVVVPKTEPAELQKKIGIRSE